MIRRRCVSFIAAVGLVVSSLAVSRPMAAPILPTFSLVNPLPSSQSANWAGYEQGVLERGETFTHVAATWMVPAASAHQAGISEASALWVGIGGGCPDPSCSVPLVDPTLIQAGTEHEVAPDGTATYYAWWETFPLPSVRTDLDVQPGDVMHVDINFANGMWTITVTNLTTTAEFTTNTAYPATMSTAEWILEAPTVIGAVGPAPMPSLSSMQFGDAVVNHHNADLSGPQMVSMTDTHGSPLATPSSPGPGGNTFSICQWSRTC